MKLISEIIDLKITFLYSLMMFVFNLELIKTGYAVVSGFIFIGYNLHRWYIMYRNDRNKKKTNK
ncbi:hypothetical protein [Flavobacterium sp. SOK18b]|uniref:hypothetical protein n=1 Tax=Flavobacterium sp. SOK18b TaxID=797900 RepID=UPI0015FD7330|nr:hypothetical protein [Flavobacterium sp. SOK18b]